MNAINILNKYDTYKISSGMGGLFQVKIIEELPNNLLQVKIVNAYDGFDGKTIIVYSSDIKPFAKRNL